jgi:hypothetical protein
MKSAVRVIALFVLLAMIVGISSALIDDFNTQTLLHFDANEGSGLYGMVDEGNRNWTASSTAHVTTTNPKFGIGSLNLSRNVGGENIYMYPSGYSGYSTAGNDATLNFNWLRTTDDFTIDCWVYPTRTLAIGEAQIIMSYYDPTYTTGSIFYFQRDAASTYLLYTIYQNSTALSTTYLSKATQAEILPINTWTHVAVIQSSRSGKINVAANGVIGNVPATNTIAVTTMGDNVGIVIGSSNSGANWFDGRIDEFRISRGIARWANDANFAPPTAAYSYPYYAWGNSGNYGWTAPTGWTKIGVQAIGGGAGGQGGHTSGATQWAGWGGYKGTSGIQNQYSVVPGSIYNMQIGTAGWAGLFWTGDLGGGTCTGTPPGAGGTTLVFGMSLPGGTVNYSCPYRTVATNGENGLEGWNVAGSGTGTGFGVLGKGFGAGGGGSGNTAGAGTAGTGSQGIILIYPYGFDKRLNYPNFTVSPATTTPGTLVNFTDTSIVVNGSNMQYNWDFGDGTAIGHTVGNTTHVYGYAGSFSVNLTITGGLADMYNMRENVVVVTNSQATTYMVPHSVAFTLVDYNMNPLEGVTVTATPQNFTAPDGWLQQYYGVAPGVALNGTTLTGVSGYDGTWVAPMLGAYRYNMTFYKAGVLNSYSYSTFPIKEEYTLKLPIIGTVVQPTPAQNYISYYLYNNTVNSTAENFTIKYKDTSGGTGTIIYNITNSSGYQKANGTIAIAGGVGWVNTTTANVSHTSGESLTVRFSAPQSQVGYVNKSYTVTWDNLRTLAGYPPWVGNWLGIAVLVLFAGSVSLVSVKYAAIIIPVLAVFLVVYARWLDPVIGVTTFIASAGILFTLGVLRYIRDQKGKLGRT